MLTAVSLGKRVRTLRIAHGLSQERLARDADVSHSTVWNVEAGRKMPDIATALAMARALGVTLNDLVLEEEGESAHALGQAKPDANRTRRREDRQASVSIRPRRVARAPQRQRGRLSAG